MSILKKVFMNISDLFSRFRNVDTGLLPLTVRNKVLSFLLNYDKSENLDSAEKDRLLKVGISLLGSINNIAKETESITKVVDVMDKSNLDSVNEAENTENTDVEVSLDDIRSQVDEMLADIENESNPSGLDPIPDLADIENDIMDENYDHPPVSEVEFGSPSSNSEDLSSDIEFDTETSPSAPAVTPNDLSVVGSSGEAPIEEIGEELSGDEDTSSEDDDESWVDISSEDEDGISFEIDEDDFELIEEDEDSDDSEEDDEEMSEEMSNDSDESQSEPDELDKYISSRLNGRIF